MLLQLVLLGGFGVVRIVGSSTCPDTHDIQDQLNRRLRSKPEFLHLATVDRVREGLQLRLFDTDGQLLAERLLPPLSCDEAVRASVLVLASWEARLVTDSKPMIKIEQSGGHLAAIAAPNEGVVEGQRVARWDVGLAGFVLLAPTASVALGGSLRASLEHLVGSGGVQGSLFFTGRRSIRLGSGLAEWSRFGLALGVHERLSSTVGAVEIGADLLGAVFVGGGSGFSTNAQVIDFNLGVAFELRSWLWSLSPRRDERGYFTQWVPWLGLLVVAWPGAQVAELAGGPPRQASFPEVEIGLGLGLSLEGR